MDMTQTQPTPASLSPGGRLAALHCSPRAGPDTCCFDVMEHAFRPHGGFASADQVMRRLRRHADQPLSLLARWIVSRSVIHLSWREETLMPMFQFDLDDMSVRPSCIRVIAELAGVYDDWELALWFATPNAWLDHAAPVTCIASDGFAVLQAARTDRFIARG